MKSTAPFGPQPQPGVLNNSQFHNLNGGNFYNTAGDAHIYNSTNSSANQLAYLHRFVAASALHDSNERFPQPRCHPLTRKRILQNIFNWAEKDSEERILWLSGSAGTGKSAIAQTVAEHCKQNGSLAAAFFFFRGSPERNTSAPLVATLAYQIALSVPGAKDFITRAIEDDPALFSRDINSQVSHLIVFPLMLATQERDSLYKFLIIVDGLDECADEQEQSDILSAISITLRTHELPLRFLIASRPEYHIRTRFERTDLQSVTVRFVLDVDEAATRDIATYLETEFSRIHEERHIRETPWPAGGVIRSLAERACGQFIYASTIIDFLNDLHFQPQERLGAVLGTLPHGIFSPFAELDLLYTQILDTSSNIDATLLCLGTILFIHECDRGPYSHNLTYLDQLFQLNPGGVEHLLMNLHSVLNVQPKVSIRHKSFSDFLTDEARSGEYFIDKEIMLAKISRLLWATITRCLNQFEDFESVPGILREWDNPLSSALHNWTLLLPEGKHAREVLGELSAIADLVEKKTFDVRLALEKLPYGIRWGKFYPVIIFWLSREKLDERSPILLNKYISFYDKDVIHFLKQVEFLDPPHSIHSFLFSGERWANEADILSLGAHSHFEVFDNFFSDPRRSGKYYLTPQDRADIVVWMVQRFPRTSKAFGKLLYNESSGPRSAEKLLHFLEYVAGRLADLPIDIHLSRASPRADTLIDLIHSHNPDTFLLGCCKNNVGMGRYSMLAGKSIEKINKAMARYLLDNSRLYEQSIKENMRIRSSFRRKRGMFSLLPVVVSLLMLASYFKFQWIFSPVAPL